MKPLQLLLLFFSAFIHSVAPYCWKPNTNPFLGVPEVHRIDASSVRVLWEEVFPNGTGCEDVDFLIKSHPLDSPSNYKLSDFTLRGQRTATLAVPPGTDFIFQVIARENKGAGVGIEYAYSRPATSLSNPTQEQKESLRQSIWVAGTSSRSGYSGNRNYDAARSSALPPPPALQLPSTTPAPPRYQPRTPQTPRYIPTASTTTERVYARPMLKSLDSNSDYYNSLDEEVETFPWYIYECVPLLKNLAGFEDGSKKNNILKKFIQHMNGNTIHTVEKFIQNEKSCKKGYEGRQQGHLVDSEGTSKCCSTPWGDNSHQPVCYDQFARCDGHCIPHDWVADGWPDCMDGADEANMAVDGKVLPYQLGCVHCAGVVLSAGFLCREAGGLTRSCVESILGPGQCNVCIGEYMNLP